MTLSPVPDADTTARGRSRDRDRTGENYYIVSTLRATLVVGRRFIQSGHPLRPCGLAFVSVPSRTRPRSPPQGHVSTGSSGSRTGRRGRGVADGASRTGRRGGEVTEPTVPSSEDPIVVPQKWGRRVVFSTPLKNFSHPSSGSGSK